MNIIADTGAVGSIVIISKNLHLFSCAACSFHDYWNKICRVLLKSFDSSLNIVKNNKSIIVNLGSQQSFSVTDVLETARKITGKPIPAKITGRRSGDPAKLTASSALAFELLGWKAEHSDMETLIKTSWEVYRC